MTLIYSGKLRCSPTMSHEYCCTIVRIGNVTPIEGSDFLGKVEVEGRDIVVRKDMVKEGDLMFYAQNECQLDKEFLSVNNMFSDASLNKDHSKKGYFNKNGRVRLVKLRGVVSMGFLFTKQEMENYCGELEELEIGKDFDTVDGKLFVKAYVPPVKEYKPKRKHLRSVNKFDRMIPGEFAFHYDTGQLNREIQWVHADDDVTITVKLHGTSVIIGNVLVNNPIIPSVGIPFLDKILRKVYFLLPKKWQKSKQEYDVIYSSRTVIKNKDINEEVTCGYYGVDVWADYYELLKDKIEKGTTIYGEIIGYIPNSSTMIQKGYDYGCKEGENKLMIYRVHRKYEDGTEYEYNVEDVYGFTLDLIKRYPELALKIHPIDILYSGEFSKLYPELDPKTHWHENVLEAMKNDTKHLGMELNEPLCNNKVPREGVVLRINNDPLNEAFKLKSVKFLAKEAALYDADYHDIETEERY